MSQSITKKLAAFISTLTYEKIPAAVREHIKLCLLDSLGCGLWGSTLPWGKILANYVKDIGGKEEASIWGTDYFVPIENAVLANGNFIHGFEGDDLHKKSIVHLGSVTLPVVLGFTQKNKVDGQTFLTALIAGYEVGARIGMSVGTQHLHLGFHPTGTNGTFAAAAAAAYLLNLNEEQTTQALGIAGTQAAGLMASQYSSMVKRMHAGRASQSGVYAARLAQRGFTGITNILEASYGGYCGTYAQKPDMKIILESLGSEFEAAKVGFKPYCCCGSIHTTLDGLKIILSRRPDISADQIKEINVYCSTATKNHVGWPYLPDSVTTAQMNLAFCAASFILDQEVFVQQFQPKRLKDQYLLKLTRLIHIIADPDIDRKGDGWRHAVRLKLILRNGVTEQVEVQQARGSEINPLSPAEVRDKYRRLAAGKLSSSAIEKTIKNVSVLERSSNAREALRPFFNHQ